MRLGVSVSRFSPLVGSEADKIKFGEVLSGLIFAVFKLAWYSGWLWPGAAAAAPSAAWATARQTAHFGRARGVLSTTTALGKMAIPLEKSTAFA